MAGKPFYKAAIFIVAMQLMSCRKYSDYILYVENRSNIPVSGVLLKDYIDTIPANVNDLDNGIFHLTAHGGHIKLFIANGSSLRDAFGKGAPWDTMSLVLFNSDTLRKYGWDNTRRNYRILKRYDLTYDSIAKLRSQVYYQ